MFMYNKLIEGDGSEGREAEPGLKAALDKLIIYLRSIQDSKPQSKIPASTAKPTPRFWYGHR